MNDLAGLRDAQQSSIGGRGARGDDVIGGGEFDALVGGVGEFVDVEADDLALVGDECGAVFFAGELQVEGLVGFLQSALADVMRDVFSGTSVTKRTLCV